MQPISDWVRGGRLPEDRLAFLFWRLARVWESETEPRLWSLVLRVTCFEQFSEACHNSTGGGEGPIGMESGRIGG